MRQKFVAANWKMHTTAVEAKQLARAVVDGMGIEDRVTVAICPPFPYLAIVGEILEGSRVALGAQNLYPEKEGAFTGEVSPTMLLDLGCKYVILGHSDTGISWASPMRSSTKRCGSPSRPDST